MGLGETPIGSNGLPIPMPDQIDCLIADTGIVVEAVLHKDAPRPPSDLKLVEYVEKAKNRLFKVPPGGARGRALVWFQRVRPV